MHKTIEDCLPAIFALLSKHVDIDSKNSLDHVNSITGNDVLFAAFEKRHKDSEVVTALKDLFYSLSMTEAGSQDMFSYLAFGHLGKMKDLLDEADK